MNRPETRASILIAGLILLGLLPPLPRASAATPSYNRRTQHFSTEFAAQREIGVDNERSDEEIDDPARGGPSCRLALSPLLAYWGGDVTLTSTKPGRFGAARGKVALHEGRNPTSALAVLSVTSWKDGFVSARLPSVPPRSTDTTYYLSVTRANKAQACGFLSLASRDNAIAPLDIPACTFDTSPESPFRGSTITLRYTPVSDPITGRPLNQDFGTGTGIVKLHDATNVAGPSPELDVIDWTNETITVRLNSDLSAQAYSVSVTREGSSSPCHYQTMLAIREIECSQLGRWAAEAYRLEATGTSAGYVRSLEVVGVLDVDEAEGAKPVTLIPVRTDITNPLTELIDGQVFGTWSPRFQLGITDTAGDAKNVVKDATAVDTFRLKPALAPEVGLGLGQVDVWRGEPPLRPQSLDEKLGRPATEYLAHLGITVEELPGCGSVTAPTDGDAVLKLVQLALPIPNMALFYENDGFENNLLVFLPSWTTIPVGTNSNGELHWDDRNRVRGEPFPTTEIANRFESIKTVLSAVMSKFGGLADGVTISGPVLDILTDQLVPDLQSAAVISAKDGLDLKDAVIDQECGWPLICPYTFDDKISSMVLVGFNPTYGEWTDDFPVHVAVSGLNPDSQGIWYSHNRPGDILTAIRRLSAAPCPDGPATDPPGPYTWPWTWCEHLPNPNDLISHMRFINGVRLPPE